MLRRLPAVTCIVAALAAGGCSSGTDLGPIACTANMVPGIVVEMRDATDGHAIADLASGIASEGAFTDSLRPFESTSSQIADLFSRQAALERKGTYHVHVERAGYLSWDTSGIVVTADVCHVQTVRVRARLTRLP